MALLIASPASPTHSSPWQVQSQLAGNRQQRGFRNLPAWLHSGSAPTTVLGQALGLTVVTPQALCQLLEPHKTVAVSGILWFRLLKIILGSLHHLCPCHPGNILPSCWVWYFFGSFFAPLSQAYLVSLSTSSVAYAEVVLGLGVCHLGNGAWNPVFLLLDFFSWSLETYENILVPGFQEVAQFASAPSGPGYPFGFVLGIPFPPLLCQLLLKSLCSEAGPLALCSIVTFLFFFPLFFWFCFLNFL